MIWPGGGGRREVYFFPSRVRGWGRGSLGTLPLFFLTKRSAWNVSLKSLNSPNFRKGYHVTGTTFLLARLGTLLSTDVSSIASATLASKVHLAQAPFTPSASLTIASFTEATFTGYAALVGGVGTQQLFTDPLTGFQSVQLLAPAGGWHWATTAATSLPQTMYGTYVTDNAVANLFGSALFASPFTLTATAQGVDAPVQRWEIPTSALQ